MKKSLTSANFSLSMFEKHALNELSTIQGGVEGDTSTAPENTKSSSSDPDTNSTDSDGGGGPIIIVVS